MTIERIAELQDANGLKEMQDMINSGQAWLMEGSYGRAAMQNLELGACMLPEVRHKDYYGNPIPSRKDMVQGTKGTLEHSINFWDRFENGEV